MMEEKGFSCWEIRILKPAVKRLQFVYQVLHRTVDKFKEDIKRLPKDLEKHFERFFEIEHYPKLFVFSTTCMTEEDLQSSLTECGMLKESSDVSISHLTKHKEVSERLEQAVANDIPMVAVVLVSKKDIVEERILPHLILNQLKHSTRKTIMRDFLLVLNLNLNTRAELNEKIAKVVRMEASLSEKEEPLGSRVFHAGDKMLPGLISRKMEQVLQKRVEKIVSLIGKATYISPKSLLEKEIHIVFIWDIRVLRSRANEFRLPDYKVRTITTDSALSVGPDIKLYGKEIFWDLVRCVREDIFKNNNRIWNIWDDLEQLFSKHDGCEILRSPMKEHFQSYIDGMIIGAAPIYSSTCLCARSNPNSSRFRERVADCMIQILKEQQEFISGEIKQEIRQQAKSLLDLQQVLRDWEKDLQNCLARCFLHDDIPFEVQIGLSRVPEVRTFGIWNGKFHIAMTPPLDHVEMLPKLQKVVGNYKCIDESMVVEYKKPVAHFMSGSQINQQQTRVGMITMFVLNENESTKTNLYCLTCKHVVPQQQGPVYVIECRGCQESCRCPPKEFGVNAYSFGVDKESMLGGLVDISCVKVHEQHVPLCDYNIRGCKSKLTEIQDFRGTVDENVGKHVFKWDASNEIRYEGLYDGIAYIRPSELNMVDGQSTEELDMNLEEPVRKVDLIKSSQTFGRPGQSGALVCIQEEREHESDIISPAFVYLGKWEQSENMYMCFRLQEGLDCLYSEYKIHLSQCTNNTCEKPCTLMSSHRKRKLSNDS